MTYTFKDNIPIYIQIEELLKERIVSGVYQPGTKIPAVRDLGSELGVNPNTIQKAFVELEKEGVIDTKRTSGRFVSEDLEKIESLRNELAMKCVQAFKQSMENLGLEYSDILEYLNKEE